MSEGIIRPAVTDDYIRVMELYNQFVGQDRYSAHDNDSFKQVVDSPTSFLFVLEVAAEIVALASYSVRRVVRYPRLIAELEELYVMPDQRGKGFAKQLMSFVENDARQHDCYRMYIESAFQHEAAHGLYEGLGYKKYGYHFVREL